MNHPPHAQLARGLQHVERTFDIGVHIGIGRVVRIRNSNQCSQVKNSVAALHRLPHPVRVANVAGKDIQVVSNVLRRVIQPTPGVEGVIEDEGTDIETLPDQSFREMRTDETIRTSYKNFQRNTFTICLRISRDSP